MQSFLSINDLSFQEGQQPQIELKSIATQATEIRIEGFTKNGMFRLKQTPASDGTPVTQTFDLDDFPIMFSVRATGTTIERGECFVRCLLKVGGNLSGFLCQGYVDTFSAIGYNAFGQSTNEPSFNGRGVIKSIGGTNPAANAQIEEVVPENRIWRVIGMHVQFVADSNVANRRVHFFFTDGSDNKLTGTIHAGAIVADETTNISLGTHGTIGDSDNDDDKIVGIPQEIYLPEGFKIITETVNMQSGDNFGAPRLLVEEWIRD